jgi:tRNA-dihydrouridine synthase B
MAGVTDLPFRRLCARFGAGLLVGEMVHSIPACATRARVASAAARPGARTPLGTDRRQRPGADGRRGALQRRRGAQVIDINMGCPAKKVCRKRRGLGAARHERLVADILQGGGSGRRRARDPENPHRRRSLQHRNGPTIARIAEDAGIALLSVHGRTRACGFTGEAVEHDTTARIVEAVDIPVLANGDIRSIADDAQPCSSTPAPPAS